MTPHWSLTRYWSLCVSFWMWSRIFFMPLETSTEYSQRIHLNIVFLLTSTDWISTIYSSPEKEILTFLTAWQKTIKHTNNWSYLFLFLNKKLEWSLLAWDDSIGWGRLRICSRLSYRFPRHFNVNLMVPLHLEKDISLIKCYDTMMFILAPKVFNPLQPVYLSVQLQLLFIKTTNAPRNKC